jgi:hypothetical protein
MRGGGEEARANLSAGREAAGSASNASRDAPRSGAGRRARRAVTRREAAPAGGELQASRNRAATNGSGRAAGGGPRSGPTAARSGCDATGTATPECSERMPRLAPRVPLSGGRTPRPARSRGKTRELRSRTGGVGRAWARTASCGDCESRGVEAKWWKQGGDDAPRPRRVSHKAARSVLRPTQFWPRHVLRSSCGSQSPRFPPGPGRHPVSGPVVPCPANGSLCKAVGDH